MSKDNSKRHQANQQQQQQQSRETVKEVAAKAAVRLALSPQFWWTLLYVTVWAVTGAPPAW